MGWFIKLYNYACAYDLMKDMIHRLVKMTDRQVATDSCKLAVPHVKSSKASKKERVYNTSREIQKAGGARSSDSAKNGHFSNYLA